jgi:hypothetical protein
MTPDIEDLLRQIEVVKADAPSVCAGLTESQFNWRPGPDRWSIAECLVHLNLSVDHTLPAFDRAIAQGRAKEHLNAGPFRYGWFTSWNVRFMEPPVKRRMKTFKLLQVPPGASHAQGRVLADFLALRDQLAERVRQADGLDLRRIRVVSPVSWFFRLPLGGYFRFVVAHDRRHLWQARQVRSALSASRQT